MSKPTFPLPIYLSMNRRRGFSYVEMLVVISVLGVMVAMMLPAVSTCREAARRSACTSNVMQLMAAVQNYDVHHEVYPPGTIDTQGPILSQPLGYHHNWLTQLLPYLEEKNTADHVDSQVSVYHANNLPVRRLEPPLFRCPSVPRAGVGYSDYAGVHHDKEAPIDVTNNGVFFLNSHIGYLDLTDGSSHTLFIGEKWTFPGDLGWMSGTRATLRNAGMGINAGGGKLPLSVAPKHRPPGVSEDAIEEEPPLADEDLWLYVVPLNSPIAGRSPKTVHLAVGHFGSMHPGGAIFAFGDGSVRYQSESTDPMVFSRLANRADGKLLYKRD